MKDKEKTLKEVINESIRTIDNDIILCVDEPEKVAILSKYRTMLYNIDNVCKNRNRY